MSPLVRHLAGLIGFITALAALLELGAHRLHDLADFLSITLRERTALHQAAGALKLLAQRLFIEAAERTGIGNELGGIAGCRGLRRLARHLLLVLTLVGPGGVR